MLVSNTGNFIFTHVHKTAGTSIEQILKEHFPDAKHWHGRHGHVRQAIDEIGRERWDSYYSFAFVRNPWDRMVSWYTMIQSKFNELSLEQQSSSTPFESPFWNYAIQSADNFETFLLNCTDIIYDKGCHKSFAFNQVDYLADRTNEIAVGYVGRFENLSEDASIVFRYLGIDLQSLPQHNKSRHQHYSHYYTPQSCNLIAQRFQKDIEKFGYTYETDQNSK